MRKIYKRISNSPSETMDHGEDFARHLGPGSVVGLTGSLGAGKTVFIKGVCRGLGYDGEVTSPSFVHVHEYRGRFTIYHADLYLDRSEASVMDLGLDELYDEGGIVLVEWADRFSSLLPDGSWWVRIDWHSSVECTRTIHVKRNTEAATVTD